MAVLNQTNPTGGASRPADRTAPPRPTAEDLVVPHSSDHRKLPAAYRVADPEAAESVWSLVAFWLVAFTAAGLFAAVMIAPRWEVRERTSSRVAALAAQCHRIAGVNQHLERIVDAIKHDPDFTVEMARHELGYVVPGETRLPAPIARPGTGRFTSPQSTSTPSAPAATQLDAATPPLRPEPWAPYVRMFAHDRLVRQVALLTAAVFLVVAMVCFNPRTEH